VAIDAPGDPGQGGVAAAIVENNNELILAATQVSHWTAISGDQISSGAFCVPIPALTNFTVNIVNPPKLPIEPPPPLVKAYGSVTKRLLFLRS